MLAEDPDYRSLQMVVQGTWSKTAVGVPAQVYAIPKGENLPVVIARGRATVSLIGEPRSVRIEGWRPGLDWDKLGGTMGPGEWVCTPIRAGQS